MFVVYIYGLSVRAPKSPQDILYRDVEENMQDNGSRNGNRIGKNEINIVLACLNVFVCRSVYREVKLVIMHRQRNCLTLADNTEQKRERSRNVILNLGHPAALFDFQTPGALRLHDGV